jgi:transposase InsO family protein
LPAISIKNRWRKGVPANGLLCERLGIERQKSEPYNQASNGKAERAIRTVMDLARTILLASGIPITFWGDAVLYARYILNRVST